jgi:hypothetical protein
MNSIPTRLGKWKKQFLEGATAVFGASNKPLKVSQEPDTALLYEQIGRLQVALAFFKKS